MKKDNEQIERLHDRIAYLEGAVSEFYDYLHRRHDAAIEEKVPAHVQEAREEDESIHGVVSEG